MSENNRQILSDEEAAALEETFRPEEIDRDLLDPPLDAYEEQVVSEEQQLIDTMARFAGESGASIWVYRLGRNNSRNGEYIEDFLASDIGHEELMRHLRDAHGGGRFKVQVRNSSGHVKLQKRVAVVEKPKEPEPEKSESDTFATILLAMDKNQAQARQDFQALMVSMQKESMQAAQRQMDMVLALIKDKPEPAPVEKFGPTEMITLMASMRELFGAGESKSSDVELLLRGMELGKEQSGDDNVLNTLVKSAAGPLAKLADTAAAQPMAPQLVPYAQTVPQANVPRETPAIAATNSNQGEEKMLLAKLRQFEPHLNVLINAARINADPDIYANYLLDQMQSEDAAAILGNDDLYGKLFDYMPVIRPLKGWFDQCRKLVLDYIAEEQSPTPGGQQEGEALSADDTNTPEGDTPPAG